MCCRRGLLRRVGGEWQAADLPGTYCALYPYNAQAVVSGGTQIVSELESVRQALQGSFAPGCNPSVAVADADRHLMFRNTCALLKFTLELPSGTFLPEGGYEVVDGVYHIYNEAGLRAWGSSGDLSSSVVLEADIVMSAESGPAYQRVHHFLLRHPPGCIRRCRPCRQRGHAWQLRRHRRDGLQRACRFRTGPQGE